MDINELSEVIETLENQENRDETDERALMYYKSMRNEYYSNIVKGAKTA